MKNLKTLSEIRDKIDGLAGELAVAIYGCEKVSKEIRKTEKLIQTLIEEELMEEREEIDSIILLINGRYSSPNADKTLLLVASWKIMLLKILHHMQDSELKIKISLFTRRPPEERDYNSKFLKVSLEEKEISKKIDQLSSEHGIEFYFVDEIFQEKTKS